MRALRRLLDAVAPHFEAGGRFEKLFPAYEAIDTLLYSPSHVTRTASHVRDGLDLKRMMSIVVVALVPCILVAVYNTGYQASFAISQGASPLDDWQSGLFTALGGSFDPESFFFCCLLGALYFVPILVVCYAVGLGIEIASAIPGFGKCLQVSNTFRAPAAASDDSDGAFSFFQHFPQARDVGIGGNLQYSSCPAHGGQPVAQCTLQILRKCNHHRSGSAVACDVEGTTYDLGDILTVRQLYYCLCDTAVELVVVDLLKSPTP